MRLSEIITEAWGGSTSFGGTGQGIFRQAQYEHVANGLHDIPDEHAKEYLTDWFIDIFQRDKQKFKPDVFRRAVANGCREPANPRFQARHYYYLAHFVCQLDDPNIKDFVANWLAKIVGQGNPDFRPARWKKFCGLELAPDEEKVVNSPRKRRFWNDETGRWDEKPDPGRGYKEED